MGKSIALLTIAAFVLSAPLHARTLSMPAGPEESAAGNTSPDPDRPECSLEAAQDATTVESAGGLPDTEAAPREAQATSCCWVYMWGRWWCMAC